MTTFRFIFVWLAICATISRPKRPSQVVRRGREYQYNTSLSYAIIPIIPIIYLVALAPPKFDTVLYMSIFRAIPSSFDYLMALLQNSSGSVGWDCFVWIMKNLTGGNETLFRLALALLHSIPLLFLFRKYSCSYLMSLYLFLTTGCHIAWMMNGLRQYLAVCLIVLATPLMLKKKYLPLVLVILLASTIHSSAIIMLPIVFIVQGEPWNKRTVLFSIGAIALTFLFSRNAGLIDIFLVNTEYAGLSQTEISLADDGTNPIRVLVASVPAILAFVTKKKIKADSNPVINLCVNMSMISAGIYLISMVTSGIMIGRVPIYTNLYSYVLLPYIIKKCFKKQASLQLQILMVVMYFAYYLYGYGHL